MLSRGLNARAMANENVLRDRWDEIFHQTPQYQTALKTAAVRRANVDQQFSDAIDQAMRGGNTQRAGQLQAARARFHAQPDPTVKGLDAFQSQRVNTAIGDVRKQRAAELVSPEHAIMGFAKPGLDYYQNPDFSQVFPYGSIDRTMGFEGGARAAMTKAEGQAAEKAKVEQRLDPTQQSPEQAAATAAQEKIAAKSLPERQAAIQQLERHATMLDLSSRQHRLMLDFGKTTQDQSIFNRVMNGVNPSEKAFILKQPPEKAAALIRLMSTRIPASPNATMALSPFEGGIEAGQNFSNAAAAHFTPNTPPTVSPPGRPAAEIGGTPVINDVNYMGYGDVLDDSINEGGF